MERMLRPTKIDALPLSTKDGVIEDVRDCRSWYGQEWEYQNRDRRLDRARSHGQVYYGLAIERTFWEMPGEPDIDEDEEPGKALKAREDYFMENAGHSFRIEPISPMTVMFAPIHDPKVFIEEGEMALYDVGKLKGMGGETYGVDDKGKVYIRGDKEPMPEWNSRAGVTGPKIHFFTHAWEDEETEEWHICEYITGAKGDSPDFANMHMVSDEIVPFGRCPYEVIPSGNYDPLATDPHLAFRPRLDALYVDINDLNQVETKLWAYAVRATNAVAVGLDGPNPEATWQWLEQQYGQAEGDGAQRGMELTIPDNGPGTWPIVPRLIKIPFEVDQGLLEQRKAIYARIEEHKPSRFQTGDLGKTEATEMKATTNANAWEASALPIEHDLAPQDSATQHHMEKFAAAIRYWPENKIYPFLTTGQEPLGTLVSGQTWDAREVGDTGFVNAKKMSQKHRVIVKTRNQTLAEEQIAQLMAAQDETNGIITHDQHLERRGVDDVHKQLQLLETDRQIKDLEPHVRQLMTARNQAIFDGVAGVNTGALLGLPPSMAPQLPGAPTYPGPLEATANRSGTGPPSYKPPFFAEGQQQPAGNPQNIPHGVQPSPVGWGQGSSPTGSGMP